MINGAQVMVKCLENEGVSIVFGYPGAAICPFYDALMDSSIRHILVRQEQNAGAMPPAVIPVLAENREFVSLPLDQVPQILSPG